MSRLENHIKKINSVVKKWLQPDNLDLKEAINKTVTEGYFSFEDVRHQILHLRNSINIDSLKTWADQSKLTYQSIKGKKVLCLHAGNLPLVGFQDVLAVALAGGKYSGKISRKDPYLLPEFLNILKKSNILSYVDYSTDLSQFKNNKADAILFSGSKQSVADVEIKLNDLQIISPKTPKLIRTAHFSVAWIHTNRKETMEDLTEAVFRYGGNGCRSVAMVVAPFHLNSEKCSFTDYIESFWLNNPQHEKPPEKLFYRFAYNKAVGIEQAWLDDFLIEEYETNPDEKFLLHWIKGDKPDVERIIASFGSGLQSVYSDTAAGNEIAGRTIEPLSSAQTPPVWWRPDQIDTIEWLQKNL